MATHNLTVMGKKRVAVVVSAPAVPFPAPSAAEPELESDHFSDYGFDPQLLQFFSQPEVKWRWGRRQQRHHHHQPAQLKHLESARFKLQKPISKNQTIAINQDWARPDRLCNILLLSRHRFLL